MREAAVHRAIGGDQGLADYLPAEHALPADLRAQTSEQVLLEPLDIARAAEYFASNASECVTGSILDLEQYPSGALPNS